MASIIERWIHAHRLARAMFVAIALGGVLLWAQLNQPPALVSRSTQTGQVISAVQDGVMVIELADGKRVRAFTPHPLPRPGDRIFMRVETYEDGSATAVVDKEAWQTGIRP